MSAYVHPAARALASSRLRGGRRHVAQAAILLFAGALAQVGTVRADETGATRAPPSEALDHYNRGRAHYQAGRYREAVIDLERALELDPGSPNLVYNLARVHELLGDIDRAIGYYERYRAMLPPSEIEERQRVSGAIARLEGAKSHVVPPRAAPPPAVVVRTERGVADGAFWTLASLSVAALIAGATTGTLAVREEQQAREFVLGVDGDDDARRTIALKADRFALASDGCFAAAAVGGLTSILMYALRAKAVVAPSVALVPGGATLTLRGDL